MTESMEIIKINESLKSLSLEIKIQTDFNLAMDEKITTITMGNSGLSFKKFDNDNNFYMYFMPEDYKENCPMFDKIKFSTAFCAGFYEFYKWWKNEENFKDFPKPQFVLGTTNEKMHQFRQNLFNLEEEVYKTLKQNKNEYKYELDLNKLGKNPEVLNFLKEAHEKSQVK